MLDSIHVIFLIGVILLGALAAHNLHAAGTAADPRASARRQTGRQRLLIAAFLSTVVALDLMSVPFAYLVGVGALAIGASLWLRQRETA